MAPRQKRPRSVSAKGVFYRYANYDVPFWVRNNTRPGRWNFPGDPATQYLSHTPDGAWAHLIRTENLRTEEEIAQVRMTLWQAQIEQAMVADYGTFALADEAGFPSDALIDDDWTRCQAEAKRLRELGFLGVVAPSAALPEESTLTLFGPRLAVSWESPRLLADAIPTTKLTHGSPPSGLIEKVRFIDDPHKEFVEYRKQALARRPRSRDE